jgi:hypothetical protein
MPADLTIPADAELDIQVLDQAVLTGVPTREPAPSRGQRILRWFGLWEGSAPATRTINLFAEDRIAVQVSYMDRTTIVLVSDEALDVAHSPRFLVEEIARPALARSEAFAGELPGI